MVHGIQTGGRRGSRIQPTNRAGNAGLRLNSKAPEQIGDVLGREAATVTILRVEYAGQRGRVNPSYT